MSTARVAVAALVIALVTLPGASPAGAADSITAEGVALAAGAGCSDASLDITYSADAVYLVSGQAFTVGAAIDSGFMGPAEGMPAGNHVRVPAFDVPIPPQPDGTVLASSVLLGGSASGESHTPESMVAFFVLYRCDVDGANEVLLTCVGDFGSCPYDASEANRPMPVLPEVARPGSLVEGTGTGCYQGGGGYYFVYDGKAEPYYVNNEPFATPGGAFSFEFTMPDVPLGTVLQVAMKCHESSRWGIVYVTAGEDPAVSPEIVQSQVPSAAPATAAVAVPAFTG